MSQGGYAEAAPVWEMHREEITRLYQVQKRPLDEVRRIMETQFGFKATYVSPLNLPLDFKPPSYTLELPGLIPVTIDLECTLTGSRNGAFSRTTNLPRRTVSSERRKPHKIRHPRAGETELFSHTESKATDDPGGESLDVFDLVRTDSWGRTVRAPHGEADQHQVGTI